MTESCDEISDDPADPNGLRIDPKAKSKKPSTQTPELLHRVTSTIKTVKIPNYQVQKPS